MFRTKIRSVKTAGDPVLSAIAAPVTEITPQIITLAEEMYAAMQHFDGIGIAAPQVGVSLRLVVFDVPAKKGEKLQSPGEELLLPQMPLVAVNPEILEHHGEEVTAEEGCLSVPGIYAPVTRKSRVIFRCTTLDGKTIECECAGLLARCIQHELDHLDGNLFTDRVSPETAAKIAPELEKLRTSGAKCNFERSRKR